MTLPADPISDLQANAIATHEAYMAYVRAGFNPDQALQLIMIRIQATIIAGNVR